MMNTVFWGLLILLLIVTCDGASFKKREHFHKRHHHRHLHRNNFHLRSGDVIWAYYNGATNPETLAPEDWHNSFPTCDDSSQSPINIDTSSSLEDDSTSSFNFANVASYRGGLELHNNGHTLQVDLTGSNRPQLLGGGADSHSSGGTAIRYELAQLHFHWGRSQSNTGSEHTVDGERYDMEMHWVFLPNRPGGPTAYVVGTFIEDDGGNNNNAYNPITNALPLDETDANNPTTITDFDLTTLLPESDDRCIYRYSGSLTTPPCTEGIVWSVHETPVELSTGQIALFRQSEGEHEVFSQPGHNIIDNYRPTQPLNGRTVTEIC